MPARPQRTLVSGPPLQAAARDRDEPHDHEDEESKSTESCAPNGGGRAVSDDDIYVSSGDDVEEVAGNGAKRKGNEIDDDPNAAKRAKLGRSGLYKDPQDTPTRFENQASSSRAKPTREFFVEIPSRPSPQSTTARSSMATPATASALATTTTVSFSVVATPDTAAAPRTTTTGKKDKGKQKEVPRAGPSTSANTITDAATPLLASATVAPAAVAPATAASATANSSTTGKNAKGKQKAVPPCNLSQSVTSTTNAAASASMATPATAGTSTTAKKGKQKAAPTTTKTPAPAAGPSGKPKANNKKPKNFAVDPDTGETTVKNADHRLSAANGLQLAQQIAGAIRYRADKDTHVAGIRAFEAAELRTKAETDLERSRLEHKTAELYIEFLHLAISATKQGIRLPDNMHELAHQLARQQQQQDESMDDE